MDIQTVNRACLDAAIRLARVQQSDSFGGPEGLRQSIGVIGERFSADVKGISKWPDKRNQKGWDYICPAGRRVQVKSHSKGPSDPSRWIKVATKQQVISVTGRAPGGDERYSYDELYDILGRSWDILSVVYVDKEIQPFLVEYMELSRVISGGHLNADRDGLYVEPVKEGRGLRVYPSESAALRGV